MEMGRNAPVSPIPQAPRPLSREPTPTPNRDIRPLRRLPSLPYAIPMTPHDGGGSIRLIREKGASERPGPRGC